MVPTYRPRLWHLVFVALFGLFELWVGWLALNPKVNADYRAYYIDRTSSCFPRDEKVATGYYPLGTPVTFVAGRNGYQRDTLRWCGFMAANKQGTRSFGDYGILRLKFDVPDEDLQLTFSSFTNANSKDLPQEVSVVVNGEEVTKLAFKSAKRVDGNIRIPKSLAKAGDGGLEIAFMVPRIGPPGTNSEPVTLQIRLEALRVVPISQMPKGVDGWTRIATAPKHG